MSAKLNRLDRRHLILLSSMVFAVPGESFARIAPIGLGADTVDKSQKSNCSFAAAIAEDSTTGDTHLELIKVARDHIGAAHSNISDLVNNATSLTVNNDLFQAFKTLRSNQDLEITTIGQYANIAGPILKSSLDILTKLLDPDQGIKAVEFITLLNNYTAMSLLNAAVMEFPLKIG